jgi:hypothetical protein
MYNTANISVLQSGVRVKVGDIVCLPSCLDLAVRGYNPNVGNPHTDIRNFIQKTLYGVRDAAEIPGIMYELVCGFYSNPTPTHNSEFRDCILKRSHQRLLLDHAIKI